MKFIIWLIKNQLQIIFIMFNDYFLIYSHYKYVRVSRTFPVYVYTISIHFCQIEKKWQFQKK